MPAGYPSMTPTTLLATAYAVSNAIRQITPTYPLHQSDLWKPIDHSADVAGAGRRTYNCEWDPPVPVDDGIHGDDAGEYVSILHVFTSYHGLSEQDDALQDRHAEMPTADGQNLISTLDALVDPTTDGVIAFFQLGFVWNDATPGKAWGDHQFEVRILLAH